MLSITGVILLPAYICSSAYLWRLIYTKKYPAEAAYGATTALLTSIFATVYGFWLIYAAGLSYILVGCVIYTIGLLVFYKARKEESPDEPAFTRHELYISLIMVAISIISLVMLFDGMLPEIYSF